jgi:hypothetical protein
VTLRRSFRQGRRKEDQKCLIDEIKRFVRDKMEDVLVLESFVGPVTET